MQLGKPICYNCGLKPGDEARLYIVIAIADVAKEAYKLLPSHYCHATVNTQFTIHNKIFTIKYWGSMLFEVVCQFACFFKRNFFRFFSRIFNVCVFSVICISKTLRTGIENQLFLGTFWHLASNGSKLKSIVHKMYFPFLGMHPTNDHYTLHRWLCILEYFTHSPFTVRRWSWSSCNRWPFVEASRPVWRWIRMSKISNVARMSLDVLAWC